MRTLLSIITSAALSCAIGCDPYESPAATNTTPPQPINQDEIPPEHEAPPLPDDTVVDLDDDVATPSALTEAEVEFANKAAIGSRFEVQSAELVIREPSKAQDVAIMIRDDHQQLNERLSALAEQHMITLPTTLDSEHRDMLEQIREAHPAELADQFIVIQIDAHKTTIDLFEQAAADLPAGDLKVFASDAIPTLRRHLEALQEREPTPTG